MDINISLRNVLISICVIFTLLTITSSGLAIINARYTDTDLHLILRFLVTTIAIGGLLIFKVFSGLSNISKHSIHYGTTMGSIFLLVWISGFFISLHPNAYRDIFLNYTVIYIIITLLYSLFKKIQNKKFSHS